MDIKSLEQKISQMHYILYLTPSKYLRRNTLERIIASVQSQYTQRTLGSIIFGLVGPTYVSGDPF